MIVRVRFPQGHDSASQAERNRHLAGIGAQLLTMSATGSLSLGVWRLTSDLEWTDPFFIQDGILSHWQVWFAMTFGIGALAFRLRQYSRSAHAAQQSPVAITPHSPEPSESEVEPPRRRVASR